MMRFTVKSGLIGCLVLLVGTTGLHGEVLFPFDEYLVAYWAFDDYGDPYPKDQAPSDVVADDLAFLNDATYSDGTSLPFEDGNAYALELDGDNDLAFALDSADLDQSGSYTVAAWVRPDEFEPRYELNIISKDTPGNLTNYNMHILLSEFGFSVFFSSHFDAPASCDGVAVQGRCGGGTTSGFDYVYIVATQDFRDFGPGTWHHVVGVYDNNAKSLAVYVDGQQDGLAYLATTGAPLTNSETVQIGHRKHQALSDFPGLIDEVRIYSVALSNEQVLELVEGPQVIPVGVDIKPGSEPNCFNVNGQGVIPVAILGSVDFSVSEIDPLSLTFDGLAVRVRGKRGPLCSQEDPNGDGYMDLVCHFEDDAEYWVGGGDIGAVTGVLYDGTQFEGSDSICVVP